MVGGVWRVEWVGGWKGDLVGWVGWLLDGCVRGWVDGFVGRVVCRMVIYAQGCQLYATSGHERVGELMDILSWVLCHECGLQPIQSTHGRVCHRSGLRAIPPIATTFHPQTTTTPTKAFHSLKPRSTDVPPTTTSHPQSQPPIPPTTFHSQTSNKFHTTTAPRHKMAECGA